MESQLGLSEADRYEARMFVHHRTRSVREGDPRNTDLVVFELDLVIVLPNAATVIRRAISSKLSLSGDTKAPQPMA